jgi:hypothetical protein
MVCARKLAHIDSNLGNHDLRRRPADAGHAFQALDGIPKGSQRGLDPCVEFANGVSICSIVFWCWPIKKQW